MHAWLHAPHACSCLCLRHLPLAPSSLRRHFQPTQPLPLYSQIVPNFRVRTIPVLGPTPALFGMAAAGYILCELAGAPFEGEPILRLTEKQVSGGGAGMCT